MEKFELSLQSLPVINEYLTDRFISRSEKPILEEITALIDAGDEKRLQYYAGFGDSLRAILMNVNHYRKSLKFGFTEIVFDKYGWFASAEFLDREAILLGQSEIRIGRGPNGVWAYALSCNYGTAGSSGPLCVFCRQFPNRDTALQSAITEMKADMTKYLGNSDTTNYKQDVLQQTLKAIAQLEISRVELTLF